MEKGSWADCCSAHGCDRFCGDGTDAAYMSVQAVKPGGHVVYSTCSILPLENDKVVSKVLASWPGVDTTKVLSELSWSNVNGQQPQRSGSIEGLLKLLGTEETEHGLLILPDQAGSGPMYVCVLHKQPVDGHDVHAC